VTIALYKVTIKTHHELCHMGRVQHGNEVSCMHLTSG